jgi:hypothetical protein
MGEIPSAFDRLIQKPKLFAPDVVGRLMSIVRALSHWLGLGCLASLLSGAGVFEHRRAEREVVAAPSLQNPAATDEIGAPRAPSSAHSFNVWGRVLDTHGDPIADAEVWVEPMNRRADARTVWLGTDSDGRFGSPPVPPGLYTITAAARGFVGRAVAVELDTDVGDLRLSLDTAPSPRVLVVDPDGRPVADAVVAACADEAEVTLHSTSDGTVAFGPGALGCAARAHHARFSRSSPVRLTGKPLAVLRLERGGSIEGVVTDPSGLSLRDGEVSVLSFEPGEDERPLAGSSLELVLPLGREFRLSGLAPGAYVLAVFRHARRGDCDSSEQLAASSFEVTRGHVVRGVHIVVDPSAVSESFGCDTFGTSEPEGPS